MTPIRMGVIGCGAIAQVHHMPNLAELQDEFQVTHVCDVSAQTAEYVARRFHVPNHVTDYRELLDSDVDAVLLCQSDPKTDVAVDSFDAGKHVFIEKPVCFSLQEMDAILAARQRAGTVGQAGYMKVYDPAYEMGKQVVDEMDVRFVQVNHLHPNNALHVRQFHVQKFNDIPESAFTTLREARDRARHQAIGDVPAHVERTFHGMAGSMIHDLYGMRHMLGVPERVVSTEIWQDGRAYTSILEYANGSRCVATWIDLPDLWDFKETLEVYGDDKRVIVSYPTGFARGILSTVTIQGVDDDGVTHRTDPAIDWESPFKRELRHFHSCIVDGTPCRTPVEDSRLDVGLIIDMINKYMETAEPARG